jgi:membrane protease YdiL (CAAX protease family)
MKTTVVVALAPILIVLSLAMLFGVLGYSFAPSLGAPLSAVGAAAGYYLSTIYISNKDSFAHSLLKPQFNSEIIPFRWILVGCFICFVSAPFSALIEGVSLSQGFSVSGAFAKFFVATVQPAAEELIFRVIIFLFLLRLKLGFWLSVLGQALMFAAIHPGYGIFGQSIIFIWSILLLFTVVIFNSIWPATLLHISTNLGQLTRGILVGEDFSEESFQQTIELSEFYVQAAISLPFAAWVALMVFMSKGIAMDEFSRHAMKSMDRSVG